jgi:hypothetical protein
LDQRIIHCSASLKKGFRAAVEGTNVRFATADRNVLRFEQNDEECENLGEDRDAFEQEERQIDRAGDLRGRARLTADGLCRARCELADAKTGADYDEAQAEPGAHERNCITFHSSNPPSEWL